MPPEKCDVLSCAKAAALVPAPLQLVLLPSARQGAVVNTGQSRLADGEEVLYMYGADASCISIQK